MLFALALSSCSSSSSPGDLYTQSGCARCHGVERQGTELGPALEGLADRWTEDELTRYLASPLAFVQRDPRLQELARKYGTTMPSFVQLSEAKRRELARFLLE